MPTELRDYVTMWKPSVQHRTKSNLNTYVFLLTAIAVIMWAAELRRNLHAST